MPNITIGRENFRSIFLVISFFLLSILLFEAVATPQTQEDVSKLIKQLKNESNVNIRRKAASALGRIGPAAKDAAPALIHAMENDPEKSVRYNSVVALGRIGAASKETVPALINIFENNKEKNVRQNAISALGRIGPAAKDAVPALVHAMENDPEKSVRYSSAEALGKIGPNAKEAVPALIKILENDLDANNRQNAASAIGGIGAAAKEAVPTLINIFENDTEERVRQSAASALGRIGPAAKEAVPTLIKILENDLDANNRRYAASALGGIGPETKNVIPALITALKNDADKYVRQSAASALGRIGPEARDAVHALIHAMENDTNEDVRWSAAEALGGIGPAAKEAVPSLIHALKKDPSGLWIRENAASALGKISPEDKEVITALVHALENEKDEDILRSVAGALGGIGPAAKDAVTAFIYTIEKNNTNKGVSQRAAGILKRLAIDLSEAKAVDMIEPLKRAYKILLASRYKEEASIVELAIINLEHERDRFPWWQAFAEWIINHLWVSTLISLYLLWAILWLSIFFINPLKIIPINEKLKNLEFKPKWAGGIAISLRHLLFVGFFYYSPRVLDSWVKAHIETVRSEFEEKDTVKDRAIHIPIPVEIDKKPISDLNPADLKPGFKHPLVCLLIYGEGGAGKTSLSCQIAKWTMSENVDNRPAAHLMLPVLIEDEIDNGVDQAFMDVIKRQLQILTKEPDPISDDFLNHLLRRQRVLVIVDHLSEMSEATRSQIKPGRADFPANALIVTSRLREKEILGNLTQSTIKPMRVQGNQLSNFMEAYLRQKGKRKLFGHSEYFAACQRLSEMVADRDITVLLAKLYADQMIAQKESEAGERLPDNIPDLMIKYLNTVNQVIKEDRLKDRDVHCAVKPLAWECLKEALKPGYVKIRTAIEVLTLSGLTEEDVEARLHYLENRLRLIQLLEPIKDRYRFVLDPLSEYLAALHLLDESSQKEDTEVFWQEFLIDADAMEGQPEEKKGFFLALRDCAIAKKSEFKIPDFLEDELDKRAGLDPEAIEQYRIEQRI